MSYQQFLKSARDGVFLLWAIPVGIVFGGRFKWSMEVCNRVGNILWNDNWEAK